MKDGDTLTFVIVSRDSRAQAWMSRAPGHRVEAFGSEVSEDPDSLKCAPEYARADRLVVLEVPRNRRCNR